ncbi:MAG TPA: hypothetical protein VOA41_17560 [Candidatus Dormibacteraeota bacterium]|nr:hypothetical protein [Candidatus Dormibacteraeota bacterium]
MNASRLPKPNKLIEVMRVNGVKGFFHWSVPLIGTIILLGALETPLLAFAVLASYYGLILIHECGHLVAAHRKGCAVWSIELYPFWGITCFDRPHSPFDRCVIAWGGVLAQAVVAAPLVAWVAVFGYTRFRPVNASLTILGFFSLSVAALNLLPIHHLTE